MVVTGRLLGSECRISELKSFVAVVVFVFSCAGIELRALYSLGKYSFSLSSMLPGCFSFFFQGSKKMSVNYSCLCLISRGEREEKSWGKGRKNKTVAFLCSSETSLNLCLLWSKTAESNPPWAGQK